MIKGKQGRQLSSAGRSIKGFCEALWVRHQIWDTELCGGSFLVSSCSFCSWAFFPFFPPPPSLSSPQQTWAECQQSITWHTYSTAMPVLSPRYPLHQDQHTWEEWRISSSWELGLHWEFTMGNGFQLLLGNPPMQHSISTCQIWSLLPTGFIQ